MPLEKQHRTAAPGRPAAPVSLAEPKPSDASIDAIFVSPRVVDRDAFQQFAGKLRELTTAVAKERAALQADAERARSLAAELRADWGPEGQRVERLRKIAASLAGAGEQADRIERAAAALTGAERSVAEVDAIAAKAERAAADLSERADAAIARFEESVEAKLAEAEARLWRKLEEATAQAERNAVDAVERLLGVPVQAARQVSESLRSALERAETMVAEETPEQRRTPLADLPQGVSLRALVARAETLQDDARAAARQIESLRDQAETANRSLAKSLLSGAKEIDRLEARQSDLHRALGDAINLCETMRLRLKAATRTASRRAREDDGDPQPCSP